jgi:hypothetical protein
MSDAPADGHRHGVEMFDSPTSLIVLVVPAAASIGILYFGLRAFLALFIVFSRNKDRRERAYKVLGLLTRKGSASSRAG